MADEKTKGKDLEGVKKGRVKISLTSKNLASIERVVSHIIANSKKTEGVDVRGPIRMPTKKLKITVRKTPCGNGSKTWDRFTLKIYKVLINFLKNQFFFNSS